MRRYQVLGGGAVLIAALVAAAEPAFAQSLLQRLFGYGGTRTPEYRYGRTEAYSFASRGYESEYWEEDLSSYRTLCVRLCDGFYFPISSSVRRERLYHDSRICRKRCDGEARLYYYPTDGGSVETMVDMAGRSYSALPNAFRYRKTLVAGCTCKPVPWSPEEAARHEAYAAEAAQSVANADSGSKARADSHAVASAEGEGPYYAHQRSYYEAPPRSYPRRRDYSYGRMSRTPWSHGWR